MVDIVRSIGGWTPRDIVGRDRELAAIRDALRMPGLVTLVGPGGAGKTSLALAIAADLDRQGGASPLSRSITVDLAVIADPAVVPATVASALGARETETGDLHGAITERLGAAPTLLVLDNLEHLLPAAVFVGWVAANAGESRILATSRAVLGVRGERVMAVDPLPVPATARDVAASPAGELFLRRLGRSADAFATDDLAAIAGLCAALDGLPLAIELAAAWGTILTPRAIERRLEAGRLPLVDEQPDRAAHRHANLEQVIESSLELLGEPERTAFDHLAVFAGPFDDEAARAVLGDSSLAALRSLASLSLVQVAADADGEPRFRLLETIRAVARRRLERDPVTARAAGLAHAGYYAARAAAAADRLRDQMFGDRASEAALQDANILAALDFAMAIRDPELAVILATWPLTLAVRTGLLSGPLERLERALALGSVSPGPRADALNSLANIRIVRGDGDVTELAESAVAAARESGDPRRIARTLAALGNTLAPDAAIPRYEASAAAARSAGYDWMVANAELNLAWRQQQLGRHRESLESSGRALEAARRSGSALTIAIAQTSIADAWLALGEEARAETAYLEALPLYREIAPDHYVTATLCSLAAIAMHQGERDRAFRHLAEITTRFGASEIADAAADLAIAAAIVLVESHPVIAAHALDAADRERWPPWFAADLARTQASLESRLGPAAAARAIRAGHQAGVQALAAELRSLMATEGPDARQRLRAAYEAFTPREEEVFRLLAAGRSDPEIAVELGMSAKTASVHVANIKAKLGLEKRVEAALEARRMLDTLA